MTTGRIVSPTIVPPHTPFPGEPPRIPVRDDAEERAVGIFPGLEGIGGIQSSGCEALEALNQRFGADRVNPISYAAGSSKIATAIAAASMRGRPHTVLVWHIGLLKLLPLVDPSCSKGLAFIHGIEAWKPLDRVTTLILSRSGSILTNSDHTWQRFLQHNPRFANHAHVTVPLGIGSALTTPTPPASPIPVAVMVGRLNADEAYKGHREMIDAWPSVRSELPNATLLIVGEGSLVDDLRASVQSHGLDDCVRFVGKVSDAERDKLLADARCLVLPSRAEGFGLVYLEAMRMGRPCLVSTMDAGQEVVNPPEAGLAVDPGNRSALVAGLCRLLTAGPHWDLWSERARARYEQHFTGELFRRRLVRAIDTAIGNRTGRPLVENV